MITRPHYFEDYTAGTVIDLGEVTVDQSGIIAFAQQYDPQPMHVDPVAAAESRFGGLVASGWQTTVLVMRLYIDNYLWHPSSLASPGVDELRWTEPVRPGDTLSVRATVLDATPSRKRSDRGLVRARVEARNQHARDVLSVIVLSIIAKRPPGDQARTSPA
jgi:acyl dehydratase